MALVKEIRESSRYFFIFDSNKNTVLKGHISFEMSLEITEKNLPDYNTLKKLIDTDQASDWFTDPEYNYSCLMLKKENPVPQGYSLVTIREFFWMSKTMEQRQSGIPSSLTPLLSRAHGFLKLRQDYRYCPTCGGLLTDDKKFTAKLCTECNRLLFPRIEPCVIVLVKKDDKVLLVKNKTHAQGMWSCVAGFVEHGETLEQCVAREVLEETGIHVKNIQYRGSQSWPFPDQIMTAFHAEYESGEIRIQEEELNDAKWFDACSLPTIPKPGSVAYNLVTGKI